MNVKLRGLNMRFVLLALVLFGQVAASAETRTSSMTFPSSTPGSEVFEGTEVRSVEKREHPLNTLSPFAIPAQLAGTLTSGDNQRLTFAADWQRALPGSEIEDAFAASPLRRADTLHLTTRAEVPIADNLQIFSEGYLQAQTGTTATFSNGHSIIATTGASLAVSPKLKFSIGLLTDKRFFQSIQTRPFIGLDWDITERLKLRTLNGAFLSYGLTPTTEIDLSLQYVDQSFAVENFRGTVFMRTDPPAILQESALVGALGVRHYWRDVFSIRAFAEITGNRELHFPKASEKLDVIELPKSEDRRISLGVEGGIRF
jgi:hypothetical protein